MIANSKSDVVVLRNSQIQDTDAVNGCLQSITVNPTELCNRTCGFCPRSDAKKYPNQNLHISAETVGSLSKKLAEFGYKGRLGWSGNGEPLLTENFLEHVEFVSRANPDLSIHEINTNGDRLTPNLIEQIYSAGINHIIVSVYDGEESLEKFKSLFRGYADDDYTLRISYGDKNPVGFTNRAGFVSVNSDKISEFKDNKCYLPFYKLVIDWNGDVLVCCEDWGRKSRSELNINTHTLSEIWNSEKLGSYRDSLILGKRILSPCNVCNIHGEKVGKNLADVFYEKKL